jgi:septal ring factor EnvC (AmiA/AmiB activator)
MSDHCCWIFLVQGLELKDLETSKVKISELEANNSVLTTKISELEANDSVLITSVSELEAKVLELQTAHQKQQLSSPQVVLDRSGLKTKIVNLVFICYLIL